MNKKLKVVSRIERYFMISLGIILMVAGFYYFILPAELVVGGVTGLGLVIYELYGFSISLTVFFLNAFLLFLGLILLGKRIFLRSIYGSLLFPLVLFIMEEFLPLINYQNDNLITVMFGGFFLGLGFGLVIKYGGTSGGTDIPIRILNKKFKIPLSISIYSVDGIIILLGVIVFYSQYGINTGLYALMIMFISGKVADMVIVGSDTKKAVQIITEKPQEIKEAIYKLVDRGITEVEIKGGYSKIIKTMLITVITKQEYYFIRNTIAGIDENAFVYVTPATEIHGDFEESENE
ncbi:MAG: YitT family protein [Bacilli bacterium]|nr:YitT family protein [Bacilli bacterium]